MSNTAGALGNLRRRRPIMPNEQWYLLDKIFAAVFSRPAAAESQRGDKNNMNENATQGNGQREIKLAPGVRFTPTALILPEGLPYEGWRECGRFLRCSHTSLKFWQADWLAHGKKNFNGQQIGDCIEQLQLPLADLKNADLLNNLVERNAALTPAHHFIVYKLDPTAQHMWLELAVKEKLTPRELFESVKQGTVVKLYAEDYYQKGGGFASIEGLFAMWKMLRRQIGELWKEWTREEAQVFVTYLAPMERFARELRDQFLLDELPPQPPPGAPRRGAKP